MTATQTVASRRLDELLQDSVNASRRAVLTHHAAEGWRTFKAAFTSGSATAAQITLRAEIPETVAVTSLPRPGDLVGVTFRLGHKKCMFGSPITAVRPSDDNAVLTLQWPDELQQLQRRAYDRVSPPGGLIVAVRIWRDAPAGTIDSTRAVRHGQLEDISAGGMRVKVAAPQEIELGATYRCALTPRPGKPAIVVDALARHREAVDRGRAAIGFQFAGLEATPDGRRTLDRLARTVSQFQRGHARKRPRKNSE